MTGASAFGPAIALALVRSRARVVVNFRSRSAETSEVESEVRALGGESIAVQADMSLVNNAGIARSQSIEEVTERD
jgi:NAD(P)-dependent dehydrogenase (short-subunit alcohol dehydrogenase family)